jgi:hypothetical protein
MPNRPDDHRRFVPLDASLTSDAPGYYGGGRDDDGTIGEGGGGGPVCWKCHGKCVVVDVRALGVQKKEKKKKKTEEKQRRSAQQQPPDAACTMSIETLPVAAGARSAASPTTPMAGEPAVAVADPETTTTNKNMENNSMVMTECHICHGSGRLPIRIVPPRPGKVTRGRSNRNASAAAGSDHDDSRRTPLQPVGYQVPYYGARKI